MNSGTGARLALVAGLLVSVLMTPAAAQFDPQFNHLKCYQIKDKVVVKTLIAQNQFGQERIAKLIPQLLCLPTKKICCGGNPTKVNPCPQQIPCPPDPTPAVPVNHFKCYKIAVKTCVIPTDPACAQVAAFKKKQIFVNLLDQFGLEQDVLVGPPRYLCAPVLKTVVSGVTTTTTTVVPTTTITTTTTTTTITTTTTLPCHGPDAAGMCSGFCPPGLTCEATGPQTCNCVDDGAVCHIGGPAPCGGFCPNTVQHCTQTPGTTICECNPPNPPPACNLSSFPACPGTCPSPMVCEKDFPTAHCICCMLGGVGPCVNNIDCCTQQCVGGICN
jgi:hypothetical protein